MCEQYERWERGSRYYILHLNQDLFGQWQLTRVWGQRGAALGRISHAPAASFLAAKILFEQACRRRARKGYRLKPG